MATDEILESLISKALAVRSHAHAPTSGFLVGAALSTSGGGIFVGCNVENVSLGLTQCAERNAIAAAIAAGERQLDQIVIASDGGVTPCGACRQVMAEFHPGLVIHMLNTSGDNSRNLMTLTLPDLLPHPFVSFD